MLDLQHKKCKLGGYVRGQIPKYANVICEGNQMSFTVLLSKLYTTRFYQDFLETHLIRILSRFYPDFIKIKFG